MANVNDRAIEPQPNKRECRVFIHTLTHIIAIHVDGWKQQQLKQQHPHTNEKWLQACMTMCNCV